MTSEIKITDADWACADEALNLSHKTKDPRTDLAYAAALARTALTPPPVVNPVVDPHVLRVREIVANIRDARGWIDSARSWRNGTIDIHMSDELACYRAGLADGVPSVDEMAARFLAWRLPNDFTPDGGVQFSKENRHPNPVYWPTGTNLLTHRQAAEMVRFMLNLPEGGAA